MGPPEPPKRQAELPHVALVLGGAGVASVATVGLLKRFAEEGIKIDYIVTTGWPTLFALAHGFFKTAHDVEWFAMRLNEKDFYNAGLFELNRDYESHDRLSQLIQSSFKQRDLTEAHTPIVISATNTDIGEPEVYDRGDWKEPLLKTMSIPGIYRPYPPGGNAESVSSLRGLDVEEASHRGAKVIVAVQMYDDYFQHLKNSRKDNSDAVFRKLYLAQLTKSLNASVKQAQLNGKVALGKGPGDFAAKRAAILAGYKEGTRLAKELRQFAGGR
jgi:NTE family protein